MPAKKTTLSCESDDEPVDLGVHDFQTSQISLRNATINNRILMDFGIFWICPIFRQTHDGVRVFWVI